jgi:hypothetical protein
MMAAFDPPAADHIEQRDLFGEPDRMVPDDYVGRLIAEPNDRLRRNIEIYYEAAEEAGFPDMHNRGRFKFGWDAEKRRGIMT